MTMFNKPNFELLENNQFRKQNEILIAEIVHRLESGEKLAYVEGWNATYGRRADYYDLIGLPLEGGGYEALPVPVFGRTFGINRNIRSELMAECSEVLTRDEWYEKMTAYAVKNEFFVREIDEDFREMLEDCWFSSDNRYRRTLPNGNRLVSDGVNDVVYLKKGGFELYSDWRQAALSRVNPTLYKHLGGLPY